MTLPAEQRAHSPESGRRKWIPRLLAILAILIAGVSIAVSLDDHWGRMRLSELEMSARGAGALVAGITGTLLLSAVYHTLLLPTFGLHVERPARVAYAYALSQLVRYIPGKVVGIAFQASMLRENVRPTSLVSALAAHMMHEYAWTFGFCGILLWWLLSGNAWPLLALVPLTVALHLMHKQRYIPRILSMLPWIGRFAPQVATTKGALQPGILTATMALVWVPMTGGLWIAFAPIFGGHDSLLAALLYLIAAVVSLLMIVVPSGLVVREAVFVWLGSQVSLPPEKLLFMAVAVRIAMTAAEVTATIFLMFVDMKDRHDRQA